MFKNSGKSLFSGYNLFSLYNHGDLAWFGLTIGCLMMPGLLHIIYWISQLRCCCDDLSIKSAKFWKWILFGITFPVSIFLRFASGSYNEMNASSGN